MNTLHITQDVVSLGLLLLVVLSVVLLVVLVWLKIGRDKPHPLAYLYRLEGSKLIKYNVVTDICRIGRHPHNEVRLNSKSVSRFHAELVRNNDGSFSIHDTDSRNGLKVGSNPVRSNVLHEGDLVDIGGIRLKFTRYPRDFNVHRHTVMIGEESSRYVQPRRRAERDDAIMQVRVHNEQTGWISGQLKDVGAGGAFIQMKGQISPLAPVDVVFPVVDDRFQRWLRRPGKVSRNSDEGIGVTFTDNDPIAHQLLHEASKQKAA